MKINVEKQQQRLAQLEEVMWSLAGRNSQEVCDKYGHTVGQTIKYCQQQIKSISTRLGLKYPTSVLENIMCRISERTMSEYVN